MKPKNSCQPHRHRTSRMSRNRCRQYVDSAVQPFWGWFLMLLHRSRISIRWIFDKFDIFSRKLHFLNLQAKFTASLISFAWKNAYALTLVSMMAWAITYHAWLSFVFLLTACVIWLVKDSRKWCLILSPFIVAYAEVYRIWWNTIFNTLKLVFIEKKSLEMLVLCFLRLKHRFVLDLALYPICLLYPSDYTRFHSNRSQLARLYANWSHNTGWRCL